MKPKDLVPAVSEFLDKCAEIISNHEYDNFHVDMWDFCACRDVDSPIEHILYTALKTLIQINGLEMEISLGTEGFEACGIEITSQATIGNYRVDFLISNHQKQISRVIVECDSQIWHERTEDERRYEKKRDRFFTKQNLKFFHFTGKEIMRKPFHTAAEILSHLTGHPSEQLIDVNRIDE